MLCPHCHSERCRRSRRHKVLDYMIGVTGMRPWRCATCNRRFYAGVVALRFLPLAHCDRCGNLNLQRIAKEYVTGPFAWVLRMLRMPALRCEPCRHRFFTIRPNRRIRPSSEVSSVSNPEPQSASR